MKPYFQTFALLFAASGLTVLAGTPPTPFVPRQAPVAREDLSARIAACRAARAQAVFPDEVPTPAAESRLVVTPSGVSPERAKALTTSQEERAEALTTSQDALSANGLVVTPSGVSGEQEGPIALTKSRGAVPDPGLITYAYDVMNRRTRMDAAILGAPVSYTYDALGRLESLSNHAGAVFAFAYDDLGRRTRLTRPNGVDTEYAYDVAGQLTSIVHSRDESRLVVTPSGVSPERAKALTTSQEQRAKALTTSQEQRAKALTTSQEQRAKALTTSQEERAEALTTRQGALTASLRAQTIETAAYTYDARGFPIAVTTSAGTRRYAYDDTGQLVAATHPDQPDEAFVYDALGNHMDKGQVVDLANRLIEDNDVTYTYDANGNLTGKASKVTGETTVYEWDDRNRLTAVVRPDGGRVEFAYAFNGTRTGMTTPEAGEVRFVYDAEDIIAVTDAAGNALQAFTHGPGIDEPLAVHPAAGGAAYHLADILGTVQALTDPAGALVESYRYTAFGETTILNAAGIPLAASAFGNPYGFTAREMGPEGVPYFYRARYYDPGLRRFVSEDPIGLAGGDANLQRYAANGPVDSIDPFGDTIEPGIKNWDMMPSLGDLVPFLGTIQRACNVTEKLGVPACESAVANKGEDEYLQAWRSEQKLRELERRYGKPPEFNACPSLKLDPHAGQPQLRPFTPYR